ncbi:E3 ubiquitin-protein ligase AIRP2 isoform X2 [Andrographis paniculata]|uniref:E3 ubiquitin-protein ligase AIRP2 isoform X2 n=1 Tax=Andrographis paniculata TaxID=175694 RepID=UPI0021E6EA58|nr:E3 ubiquitin-protein ligase AIRP2 isoform X2 [Andrographis paniculata]
MEMMCYQQQQGRNSYTDSLKILESDIQQANALAAAIPKAKGGARLQMKVVYNEMTPLLMYFLRWFDCSCSCFMPRHLNLFDILIYKVYADGRPKVSTRGRKASIRDFYAVILPSLQRLHYDLVELDGTKDEHPLRKNVGKKTREGDVGEANSDSERDDECGICLEPCTKMVVPGCCHAMCINCYRDWSTRSESCPFCRGSLKRVKSRDLWVLPCKDEVIDPETVPMEDLRRFYLYIRNLPKDSPDALFLMYYEHLI